MTSNHTFEPGDFAIKRTEYRNRLGASEHRTLLVADCTMHDDGEPHWHHATGGWDPLHVDAGDYPTFTVEYRPLAVVDYTNDNAMAEFAHEYEAAARRLGEESLIFRPERIIARWRETFDRRRPADPPPNSCHFTATINGVQCRCTLGDGNHHTHSVGGVAISVTTT